MNKAEFDADANIKTSIKTGVEASLTGTTVDISTITATDASRRRLSLPEATDRRRLGASDVVHVSFDVEKEVGSSGASTAFSAMQGELSTKVADGTVSGAVNTAYTDGMSHAMFYFAHNLAYLGMMQWLFSTHSYEIMVLTTPSPTGLARDFHSNFGDEDGVHRSDRLHHVGLPRRPYR